MDNAAAYLQQLALSIDFSLILDQE